MKVKDIYDAALRMLAEPADAGTDCDYAERAPYLTAAFCCTAAQADRDFRESHRLPPQEDFPDAYIPLESKFPLSRRFAAAATYYVAAMLALDENDELSDRLFDRYSDAMSSVVSEIPGEPGKIRNMYP